MDVATGSMASLLPKLEKLLNEENKLPMSIAEDAKYLSQEMKSIRADILKVAGATEYQLNCLGPVEKNLAAEARELYYNMEVVVDRLLVYATNSVGFEGLMEEMGSLLKKGKTRYQVITDAIKDIKAQIQGLYSRRERYMVSDLVADSTTIRIDPRLAALYKSERDLVGTEGKYQELMKLLLDGDNMQNKKLKIVSVVGFGGLGKTTFVKGVCDKIAVGFDCRAFVLAGQNTDMKKVLENIILQLMQLNRYGSHDITLDERQLVQKLQEILENKRYLVVIDDIWDENLWESIKHAFSNENNLGSRIITTTRIVGVAKACCSSGNDSIYQMEPLSDDDSKKLFYKRIFNNESGCPHELEQVSKDILKKCCGMPLAILTMASLLCHRPQDQWHVLLKSIGRGTITADFRCERVHREMHTILSFSYYDLPLHLRTCLLYLCIFPVTRTIERDRVVKKWIAEGIVTRDSGSYNKEDAKLSQELNLEEAANQYLEELVNRNVIQPLERKNDCEVVTYHIHPMMHGVLKDLAIEANFAASFDDKDIASAHHCVNFAHLSVDCPASENPIDASMALVGVVRSLTLFGHADRYLLRLFAGFRHLDLEGCMSIERVDLEYICRLVLLKQLCLAKTQITELPMQIGKLKHLEILDVGGTQITQLPPQIGKLQSLKTLDARKSQIKDLPHEVVLLTKLVHLLIGDNESCEGVKLPDGIGKMKSLQQLCTIDLRKCSASSLSELLELPGLKEIAIVSSDELKDTRVNNALLSSFNKSTKLRSLVVYSDFRVSTLQASSLYKYLNCRKKLTVGRSLKVPIGFAGQQFLGMLDIRVCKLQEDDLKILGSLPRLHSLIVRFEVLPRRKVSISCEGFAELQSFCVDCRMPGVIFQDGAMPKLGHLELKLYAGSASKERMDMKHLLNLQEVRLRYSKWYAANKGVIETIDAVKNEAKEHQNKITLSIAEEIQDGTCTMTPEIFPDIKDAGCSRMTDTKEEDGHADGTCYFLNGDDSQEGDLQSSCAIAGSSGTNEIEEVVE